MGIEFFIVFFYWPFNFYVICSDVLFFISDISNLYPLSFSQLAGYKVINFIFFIYFLFSIFLIVVQVQLSLFSHHHFPPPHPSPTPTLSLFPLSLPMGPLYTFLDDPSPFFPLLIISPLLWLLSVCSLISLVIFCLPVCFVDQVPLIGESYGICPALPGLFHLA